MHSRGRKKEGCTGSQGSCWASSLFSETTQRAVIPKEEETEVPRVASSLVPQQSPVITSAVDPVSGAERGRLVSTFTEKTSQGGRQAVDGERNANVSAIKRAGRGMFGIPRIWNAPAGCGWREEKVQTTGLTTCSPQLAGTFQALAPEFSRVRNFSVAGLKLAGLRSKPTSSEGKALSHTTPMSRGVPPSSLGDNLLL